MQKRFIQHPLKLALLASLAVSGAAQAHLIDRGGGLIYDDVLDITWLQNANLFKTQYHADDTTVDQIIDAVPTITDSRGTHTVVPDDFDTATGLMSWSGAMAWAQWLDYGGYEDWRLPTLNPSDTSCSNYFNPGGGFPVQYLGTGCTGGELSHLLVADLGNKAFESVLDPTGDTAEQMANLALFSNVQSDAYWSGLEYAPGTGFAWLFSTDYGLQVPYFKDNVSYAWAVRPGDVAAAPEPATLGLLGLALAGLAAMRRRG
jgi:hypothetical protein